MFPIEFTVVTGVVFFIIGLLMIQVSRLIAGRLVHRCHPNLKIAKAAGGALMLTAIYGVVWNATVGQGFYHLPDWTWLSWCMIWALTSPPIFFGVILGFHPNFQRGKKELSREVFLDPLA